MSPPIDHMARAFCPRCGMNVACYVPRHGDGTVYVTRRHKPWDPILGDTCKAEVDSRELAQEEIHNRAKFGLRTTLPQASS